MEDIPNKIVNHLGLVVDVNLHKKGEKYYIEIDVPISTVPISYHGIYHYRSGSTKQELKGNALNQFILKKMGVSWEQQPLPEASLKDIDEETVKKFVEKAVSFQRISESAANSDTLTILKNLKLINEKGELLLAALLLFGKEPDKYALGCYFKIGRFVNSDSDLRFQDIVEGNILNMADKVMQKLNDRYLIRPISYKGLERMEPLEYPEQALREAILNSIIHKNYARTNIFLSVYNDRLIIWNPGGLPPSLSIEKLKKKHGSEPRNGLIARVFFMAGYIESWGRGIDIMMEGCRQYGIPEPVIAQEQDGISVSFLKDIYSEEYLRKQNLEERQVNILLYIKDHGSITNTQYQVLAKVSKRTASRDLLELIERTFILKSGTTGKGTSYILNQGKPKGP
jgi:ATP-dependent DNA helicase RecG